MIPDQIIQLRTLLKEADKALTKWIADVEEYQPTGAEGFMAKAGFRNNSGSVQKPLTQALALLPCETCNGTEKNMIDGCWGMVHKEIPCPDCQS